MDQRRRVDGVVAHPAPPLRACDDLELRVHGGEQPLACGAVTRAGRIQHLRDRFHPFLRPHGEPNYPRFLYACGERLAEQAHGM